MKVETTHLGTDQFHKLQIKYAIWNGGCFPSKVQYVHVIWHNIWTMKHWHQMHVFSASRLSQDGSRDCSSHDEIKKTKKYAKHTCEMDVKHSSNGNRSLSEFDSCCHLVINGGIKMSRYFGCRLASYQISMWIWYIHKDTIWRCYYSIKFKISVTRKWYRKNRLNTAENYKTWLSSEPTASARVPMAS